ncbi:MAG: tripartite tricarboxylate transporter TctB family protein [Deltaproteobacteria bacterium]|nr:tripartite tricarboxylate transporter TctB family protein [Deltaproteobacteria bacterium]
MSQMRTQRAGDIVAGIFFSLLGVFVVWAAFGIKGAPDMRMHPRTLPLILGWAVGIAGGILAFHAWRYRGPARIVPWPDRVGTLRVGVTLAALVVFLFLVEPLGMPLGSGLLVGFLVWYLGRYRPIFAGLLGLATGGVIYAVFIQLLQLSFPIGPLGR